MRNACTNSEAADEMRTDPDRFRRNVITALRGGVVHNHSFAGNKGGNPALFGKGPM